MYTPQGNMTPMKEKQKEQEKSNGIVENYTSFWNRRSAALFLKSITSNFYIRVFIQKKRNLWRRKPNKMQTNLVRALVKRLEKSMIWINRYELQMRNGNFTVLGHGLLTECKNNGLIIRTMINTNLKWNPSSTIECQIQWGRLLLLSA